MSSARYCILDYHIRRSRDVSLGIQSPALLVGDTLRETLPVMETVPVFLERHLERLRWSAAQFGYENELDSQRVRSAIDNLMTGNLREQGLLHLMLFRHGQVGETHESLLMLLDESPEHGILAAGLAPVNNRDRDPLARHSMISTLFKDQLLLRHTDSEELVLVDEEGRLLEGCRGNLFVALDGVLQTPPQELGLLPGIGRGVLLADTKLKPQTRVIHMDDLAQLSEAFLASSAAGIRPLRRLGDRCFDQVPGPLTRAAMAALEYHGLADIAPHLP